MPFALKARSIRTEYAPHLTRAMHLTVDDHGEARVDLMPVIAIATEAPGQYRKEIAAGHCVHMVTRR